MNRWVVLAGLALAGCASWQPGAGSPVALLAHADALLDRGAYESAVGAYDEVLARHGDDPAAGTARARRQAVIALLGARTELARLREALATRDVEAARLRAVLAEQEGETVRTRDELARRETELARLREALAARDAEAARLRDDLERLKQVDIRLERPRR